MIYYWAAGHDVVLMLLMYGKSERDDLSAEQSKVLVALVKEEFKGGTSFSANSWKV